MTNYEKIKNMSVEEMAETCLKICESAETCSNCPFTKDCPANESGQTFTKWLESEAN